MHNLFIKNILSNNNTFKFGIYCNTFDKYANPLFAMSLNDKSKYSNFLMYFIL